MNKVAVYGSLKKGFGNHRLLKGSNMIDETFTKPEFHMGSFGAFPGIVEGNKKVKVEVYEVDDQTFKNLDHLEGYPRYYNRKEITLENGIKAWIYFLDDEDYDYLKDEPHIENWKERKLSNI